VSYHTTINTNFIRNPHLLFVLAPKISSPIFFKLPWNPDVWVSGPLRCKKKQESRINIRLKPFVFPIVLIDWFKINHGLLVRIIWIILTSLLPILMQTNAPRGWWSHPLVDPTHATLDAPCRWIPFRTISDAKGIDWPDAVVTGCTVGPLHADIRFRSWTRAQLILRPIFIGWLQRFQIWTAKYFARHISLIYDEYRWRETFIFGKIRYIIFFQSFSPVTIYARIFFHGLRVFEIWIPRMFIPVILDEAGQPWSLCPRQRTLAGRTPKMTSGMSSPQTFIGR
jgi:hypothetical protein